MEDGVIGWIGRHAAPPVELMLRELEDDSVTHPYLNMVVMIVQGILDKAKCQPAQVNRVIILH